VLDGRRLTPIDRPSETALALHAVVSSAVLVRHASLRLCFAHAGGAYLPLLGRIQHGYDCRPDLVAHRSDGISPTQQVAGPQKNIWIDSLVHDADLLEYMCKKIGPDRVVMGSDYPFPLGEVPFPGQMIATDERVGAFLSPGQREGMLWANAVEFLKLYDLVTEWERG
jgi:aminocarboxymuconate-semialdehyde decarboxylase